MVLPFFHAGNGQTCRQNHPKKVPILPRKTQMAIRRVLVLIQVGGRAAEGGFAALDTLGASRLGRRNKHTPSQPKQSVNRKQVRGEQGAPLTRLRCPVVPAARKLVFMPPLLLLAFGVLVPFHKRVVSVNFLNTYLPITSPTLKHPNTQHIQTLCSWQPSFVQ